MSMLIVWLMVPILAVIYHLGPGQQQLALDQAAAALEQADAHAKAERWDKAVTLYEAALTKLPAEHVDVNRRIRLQRAKAQMFVKKLPTAHADLKTLVAELKDDPDSDLEVLDEAQSTLANSQYYLTWLMRLEGQPEDKWQPEIEAARQTYRMLAEQHEQDGDSDQARKCREDLDSVIRLARMDLGDLQGLPLPSQ